PPGGGDRQREIDGGGLVGRAGIGHAEGEGRVGRGRGGRSADLTGRSIEVQRGGQRAGKEGECVRLLSTGSSERLRVGRADRTVGKRRGRKGHRSRDVDGRGDVRDVDAAGVDDGGAGRESIYGERDGGELTAVREEVDGGLHGRDGGIARRELHRETGLRS